jgi:hypothetical protein
MGRADIPAGDLAALATTISALATSSLTQLDSFIARLDSADAARG